MAVSAEALQELHRIHRQRADLRDRLTQGPRQIDRCQKNVGRAKNELVEAKSQLQKGRLGADDKQLQLRDREAKIEVLKSKLNACTSNREFQTFKEQIAADGQANCVLEDEILEALERNDELQLGVQSRQAEVEAAEKEHDDVKVRFASQDEMLNAELARIEADLQEAEQGLPEEIREEYDRIATARGAESMAPVEDGFCGGCFQQLTLQTQNQLLLGVLLFCKQCGCLMYIAK
jgi:predicted  nucleic acid-binding Zn-ribbon protein